MKKAGIEALAALLFRARRSGERLRSLPARLDPRTMRDVHAVIAALDRRIPEPVAGWKFHATDGHELSCAPLYASRIYESPARVPIALVGALRGEAEVSFRLIRDLPPRRRPYEDSDIFTAVMACPALELLDTRFADFDGTLKRKPLAVAADHMASGVFVVGRFRRDWRRFDFGRMRVTIKQGARTLADQRGGHPNGSPAGALTRFVNHMRERGGLAKGAFIASGSFTGFRRIEAGRAVEAKFQGFGSASATVR